MLEKPIKLSGAIKADALIRHRKLEHMVENCTRFTASGSELNIYETHQQAERVALQFDHPVLTSMISGKKVMHFTGETDFSFVPGESLMVPPQKTMYIDFPLAQENNPTKCLALVLEKPLICETLTFFNEKVMGADGMDEWSLAQQNFHLLNDQAISSLINHLIDLYTENNKTKDLFIDFSLKELIIRLMQSQARSVLIEQADMHQNTHRLAQVIVYIQQHLHETLHVDKLSNMACLSKSHFFKMFNNHFGMSPNQYIVQERMKVAKKLLQHKFYAVTEVAAQCGFNDISYFSRAFKKYYGISPMEYRKDAGIA